MKIQMGISVRATEVLNNGDGVFTIMVEGEELPEGTLKVLRDLFPNTADRVFELLNVEALLSNIEKDYKPSSPLPPEKVRHGKQPAKTSL